MNEQPEITESKKDKRTTLEDIFTVVIGVILIVGLVSWKNHIAPFDPCRDGIVNDYQCKRVRLYAAPDTPCPCLIEHIQTPQSVFTDVKTSRKTALK